MNFSKYENNFIYPVKSDFTTVYAYNKGKLVWKKNANDVKSEDKKGVILEKNFDENAWKNAFSEYKDNVNQLIINFKKDVLEYVGLTNHPNADKAFNKVYDDFSNQSYPRMVDELEELAELMIVR